MSQPGVPSVFQTILIGAFIIAVPVTVFSLIARSGWDTLAAKYRAAEPYEGEWRPYPHAAMAYVSVDDPTYRRQQMRFIGGTLRVATTPDALHLAMLFGKVPLLDRLYPEARVPWSAVRSARVYEAKGWYAPQREPGVLLQAAYDPNYTGKFVELAIGDPPLYIQLPAAALDDAILARLPAAT